jgi:hypothetical protein
MTAKRRRTKGKEHYMFSIKKKNDRVVISKSTIPTSPSTGRQLAKVLLDNIALQAELEQVKSPEVSKDWTPAATKVSLPDTPAPAKKVYVPALTPKQEKEAVSQANVVNASKALGENVQTFVRDPFTGQALYGKDALFPTLTGGYFITNDDPQEQYYLLFNEGMTFILTSGQSQGDPMSVLYRAGSGHVSQADMQSIIKAKLSLTRLKQFYRVVEPTTH